MTDLGLCWRIEEACWNGRPSPVEAYFDGWLIRASGGPVRRTNSVNATRQATKDFASVITEAERVYDGLGRPTIFKVPSFANDIDDALASRGYAVLAESKVLLAPLQRTMTEPEDIEIDTGPPGDEWIEAWSVMEGPASAIAVEAFRRSVDSIVLPTAFACVRVDDRIVSVAYGVVHRGLIVLEAVATHPDFRGRSYASRTVSGLLAWGNRQGAYDACLAVMADNPPALALYRSLGFSREAYTYYYRRREPSAIRSQSVEPLDGVDTP
ncbi:GNAT family N-acetyltransferase [Consotaella aegiceratis]|uniref:GNAT family N-acetyltransferase n=1 Tax=Consotaella aegiceratis TaxID=3097961 RepID=UPI002F3ED3D5